MLVKIKLNSIEVLFSKDLIDSNIGHNECVFQKGKMILKKNCCQVVQTVIKECYHIS